MLGVGEAVGVAEHDAVRDRGVEAGGHGVAPVGGDDAVDPHLPTFHQYSHQALGPRLPAASAPALSAEQVHERADVVDQHDDPRQRRVAGVVRGQVLGAGVRQHLPAPGELAVEHHDVAADRLEVVAGCDVDHVRERPQHREPSRRRRRTPGSRPVARRARSSRAPAPSTAVPWSCQRRPTRRSGTRRHARDRRARDPAAGSRARRTGRSPAASRSGPSSSSATTVASGSCHGRRGRGIDSASLAATTALSTARCCVMPMRDRLVVAIARRRVDELGRGRRSRRS